MGIKVGINGFGRIGRNVFKIAVEKKEKNFEIVAINDLTNAETLAHLLKYDSCFGKFQGTIDASDDSIIVNEQSIKIFAEKDPENIPWGDMGIDIVIESTGVFRKREKVLKHIKAGAKKVIISAPSEGEDITIVMGVNEENYDPQRHNIISGASCTTNCLAPFIKIIDEKFNVKKGLMTTIHSYTNDQNILDLPHSDLRRARAAAQSIIPTTTGAAKAVGLVLPNLAGKLNGFAMRVPTPTVSIVDLVCILGENTTAEEINNVLREASEGKLKNIIGYSDEPLVSIDYKKDPRSSIIDGLSTMVLGGDMAKIVTWYDNEWGYSTRIVDLVDYIVQKGL